MTRTQGVGYGAVRCVVEKRADSVAELGQRANCPFGASPDTERHPSDECDGQQRHRPEEEPEEEVHGPRLAGRGGRPRRPDRGARLRRWPALFYRSPAGGPLGRPFRRPTGPGAGSRGEIASVAGAFLPLAGRWPAGPDVPPADQPRGRIEGRDCVGGRRILTARWAVARWAGRSAGPEMPLADEPRGWIEGWDCVGGQRFLTARRGVARWAGRAPAGHAAGPVLGDRA